MSAVAGEDIRLGCVAAGKPQPELRYAWNWINEIELTRENNNQIYVVVYDTY